MTPQLRDKWLATRMYFSDTSAQLNALNAKLQGLDSQTDVMSSLIKTSKKGPSQKYINVSSRALQYFRDGKNHGIGQMLVKRVLFWLLLPSVPTAAGIAQATGWTVWGSNPGGGEFPYTSIQDLGPTQPPIQWVPGLLPGNKAVGASL